MVQRVTEHGNVSVSYEGCSDNLIFHPGALTKVPQFFRSHIYIYIAICQRNMTSTFYDAVSEKKGRDLTQSYDKNPYTNRKP